MKENITPADQFLAIVLRAIALAVDKDHFPEGLGALEAIFALRTRMDRKELTIDDWKERTQNLEGYISIPLWAFVAITDGYNRYTSGEKGVLLGDALGVGKGGQGSRQATRDGVKMFRRDLGYALQVAEFRRKLGSSGKPPTLEATYAHVAESANIGEQTVRRAWRKHSDLIEKVFANWG